MLHYVVTYATCGATLNVLTYLLKLMKNWKMMIYLLGIAQCCLVCLSKTEKRAKNVPLFKYYKTHAKTTKNRENTE